MSYIVQYPHSLTNPGGLHRVVDFGAWKRYADGDTEQLPVVELFASFEEAQNYADDMNRQEKK